MGVRKPADLWWLVLSCVTACAAAGLRLRWLQSWPVAIGTDSYYYVIQVQSLLESGSLYFKTNFALPLYLLTGFSVLTGDPVAGFRLGSALAVCALALAGIAIVWHGTRNAVATCFAALLLSCSSLISALTVDFVANAYGMVAFLLLLLGLFEKATDPSRRHELWLIAALAACLLTHISAVILALATLLASLTFVVHRDRQNIRAIVSPPVGLVLLLLCIGGLALLALDPRALEWMSALKWRGFGGWSRFRPEAAILVVSSLVLLWEAKSSGTPAVKIAYALIVVSFVVVLNPLASTDSLEA